MAIKLLLVDDHKLMREGLAGLLAKKGFEVIGEADTGHAAVKLARTLQPDVILMDISMPDLNGVEAARQIRDENPEINIIALSMYSDKRFIAKMLAAGAKAYLRKNCTSQELSLAIRTVAGGHMYLNTKIAGLLVEDFLKHTRDGRSPDAPPLTIKESEVLQLIAEGKATKEIAAHLSISVKTAEKHRQNIMDKLGVHSIADLTKYALREGMISLDE